MDSLKQLFQNNRGWVKAITAEDPGFFEQLARQQKPEYLWIGCSDSRVPANEIVGLLPGELFVHRNIANVVVHTDLNCQSVLQYAVDVLQVKHIIVCGHYGCGGVAAAMGDTQFGLIDNWLRNIKDVYNQNSDELNAIESDVQRVNRLCELNVLAQLYNTCHTTIVQNAWSRGQQLDVHGWIYSIADGLLKDLGATVRDADQLTDVYRFNSVDSSVDSTQ